MTCYVLMCSFVLRQSLGAWLCKGIIIELEGNACDYMGKVQLIVSCVLFF